MRPCAIALLAVEVLNKGGEGVEVAAGRIPANEDLAGVGAQMQGQHLLLVVHVYLDLLGCLCVGDGIAVADLDLGAVFAAGSEQRANDALLVGGAAEGMVKYREDGLVTLCQRLCSRTGAGAFRVPGAVWRRSAGQSRVGRRRGLGQAGAPDGGRSLAQTW